MTVYMTNVWVCERCGYIASETTEERPYSDPVLGSPDEKEWAYALIDAAHICEECSKKELVQV